MTEDIMDKVFSRIHEQTANYIERSKKCSGSLSDESISRAKDAVSRIKEKIDDIKRKDGIGCPA